MSVIRHIEKLMEKIGDAQTVVISHEDLSRQGYNSRDVVDVLCAEMRLKRRTKANGDVEFTRKAVSE